MTDIEQRLAVIAQRFVAQSADTARLLESQLEASDHEQLARSCHSLAGRSAMFGFGEIASVASHAEQLLERGGETEEIKIILENLIGLLDQLGRTEPLL